MSQEQFADLLGTSKQVISRYETAQRSPKVSTVADYASKLGVRISELTGDPFASVRDAFPSDSAAANRLHEIGERLSSDSGYDHDREELSNIYDSLNQRGRADLLKYARYLKSDPDMTEDGASNTVMA